MTRSTIVFLATIAMAFNGQAIGQTPFVATLYSPDEDDQGVMISSPNWVDVEDTERTYILPAGTAIITWSVLAVAGSTFGASGEIRPAIGELTPNAGTKLYVQAHETKCFSGSWQSEIPGGETNVRLQMHTSVGDTIILGGSSRSFTWTLTVYPKQPPSLPVIHNHRFRFPVDFGVGPGAGWVDIPGTEKTVTVPAGTASFFWSVTLNTHGAGRTRPYIGGNAPDVHFIARGGFGNEHSGSWKTVTGGGTIEVKLQAKAGTNTGWDIAPDDGVSWTLMVFPDQSAIKDCLGLPNGTPCNAGSCTLDALCLDGVCTGMPIVRLYGDVFPCGGDGRVNLDDILALLRAFGKDYDCPHECPP